MSKVSRTAVGTRTAALGGLLAVVIAAAGAAVDTTAAAGAGPVPSGARVPDVMGLPEPDARAHLTRHGYRVKVFWQKGQAGDERRVVVQQPAAGTPARPSTVVCLVLGE